MNNRGQFFSPDLIVAGGVFIFVLVVFFTASNSIFSQVFVLEDQKAADEAAHAVLNELVLSAGSPANWESTGVSSAYSLGLASSNNIIDPKKVLTLLSSLNNSSTYLATKSKLGITQFDFYLKLLDPYGNVVSYNGVSLSGGQLATNAKVKYSYKRIVLFNGSSGVIEAVFSHS